MKNIKISLKDIKPNPFKKFIDEGQFNEEQIEKLIEGYKQTIFHENLLARQKDGQIQLVYGHHRLEAAKRVYGNNYVISLNIVDYNDKQMIIDLCRENLTQRFNEFRQELDAVVLVRNYLEGKLPQAASAHGKQPRKEDGKFDNKELTCKDITQFLSKEGKAISETKVKELLRMNENLDKNILDNVKKTANQMEKGEVVTYSEAVALASIKDKKEQRELVEAIKKTKEEQGGRVYKLISKYKEAPEEIKEKIRKGKLDLQDIDNELEVIDLKKKIDEGKTEKDQNIQIIKSQEIVDSLRSEILDTHKMLDSLMYKVRIVRRKGFGWYSYSSKKDFKKLISNILDKVEKWREELVQIQEEVE